LIVRLNPSGYAGTVDFDVHVTTPSEPLLSATESFRLMSGLDLLLVDDDEGGNRETWYLDALTDIGTNLICGRWDMTINPLDVSYLAGVDVVIWFTGDAWQNGTTITAEDQTMLSSYLDQGGRLFLSGQGIGFDIRTDPFFTNYIHGIYRQNYPGHFDLLAIAGDPIGDNLDLMISGGNGANNQVRHHSTDLDASGLATPIFAWGTPPGTGGYPAHKVATDTYRLVYLGFGFEAIDNATDRSTVMQRSLDWLLGSTAAGDPPNALPNEFAVGQNYPNPFNPETTIPFVLPERANVTVHVFDVLGREVATLTEGMQEAGVHAIRFNGADLSSGLYFYRLEAATVSNTVSATRKLMLLK
jgi:hypothetical protein